MDSCHLGTKRHCEPQPRLGLAYLSPVIPALAGADRGAVALAQHGRVELQLVQLGPKSLLVASNIAELLGQAVRFLLDAQQVSGRRCWQCPLWWGQCQACPLHFFLQEG